MSTISYNNNILNMFFKNLVFIYESGPSGTTGAAGPTGAAGATGATGTAGPTG
jgi:hypothetical protein